MSLSPPFLPQKRERKKKSQTNNNKYWQTQKTEIQQHRPIQNREEFMCLERISIYPASHLVPFVLSRVMVIYESLIIKTWIYRIKGILFSILSLSGPLSGEPERVSQMIVLIKTVSNTNRPLFCFSVIKFTYTNH